MFPTVLPVEILLIWVQISTQKLGVMVIQYFFFLFQRQGYDQFSGGANYQSMGGYPGTGITGVQSLSSYGGAYPAYYANRGSYQGNYPGAYQNRLMYSNGPVMTNPLGGFGTVGISMGGELDFWIYDMLWNLLKSGKI